MASKVTYECYVCKRNGFPNVRVYLDGKTEDGKTVYKNEDMSSHQHKQGGQRQGQQQQGGQQLKQPQDVNLVLEVKLLHQKLDKVISLLEERLPEAGAVLKD